MANIHLKFLSNNVFLKCNHMEIKGAPILCQKNRKAGFSEESSKQDEVCTNTETPKSRHSYKYSLLPKNLTISPVALDCSQDSVHVSWPSSTKLSNHGKSTSLSLLSSGNSPGQIFTANLSKSPIVISPALSNQSSQNTTPLSVSIWHPQAHSSPDISSPGNTPGSSNSGSTYRCDTCSKNFTSKSNLNKHHRVIHAGEEYFCPYCQRSFKNRYYIKDHINLCFTGKKTSSPQVSGMDDSIPNPEAEIDKQLAQGGAPTVTKEDISPNINKPQEGKILQFNML